MLQCMRHFLYYLFVNDNERDQVTPCREREREREREIYIYIYIYIYIQRECQWTTNTGLLNISVEKLNT